MKVPKSYRKILDMYYNFSKDLCEEGFLFFDKEAEKAIFAYETYGKKDISERNGYLQGKRLLNITITMWKEDLKSGILFLNELEEKYHGFVERYNSKPIKGKR